MSITHGFLLIGIVDLLSVILTATISLAPGIGQHVKKTLVILIFYCLSIFLLVKLSIVGPGFVYLLTLSVIITVTCKIRLAYFSVVLNLIVCLVCAAIIHFKLWNTQLADDYSLGVWITVSSNLVFLSFVIVMIIGKTIQGLEKTILREMSLQSDLHKINLEQLETNRSLRESEEHYRSLFFESPTPMWILDIATLQFLQVNQAAVRKYKYSEEEFLNMKVVDIKFDTSVDTVHAYISRSEEKGAPQTLFTRHIKKGGEVFHVEVIFKPIPFNGKLATLAMLNDLTERMEYLDSIQLQNEKLQQIAWIQNHEVRAPLASILGLAQLYDEELPISQVNEIMQRIIDSAQNLDRIIRETVSKSS